MTETLSVRLDSELVERLNILAERSNRSKSFVAAEAIARYLELEEWQIGEIEAGLAELDQGQGVSHEKVKKWLSTWGKKNEGRAPR